MKRFLIWLLICGLTMIFLIGCTPQNQNGNVTGINRTLDALEEASVAGNPEGIVENYRFPYTYETPFQTQTYSREAFLADIIDYYGIVTVTLFRFENRQVTLLDQDTARVDTVHRISEIEAGIRYTFALRTELTMERVGNNWLISRYAWDERLEFEEEPA